VIIEFEDFLTKHKKNLPFLVQQKISAELLTPVRAMLCLKGLFSPQFLLESVEGGAHRARYSVIGLGASLVWQPTTKNETFKTDIPKDNTFKNETFKDGTFKDNTFKDETLGSLKKLIQNIQMEASANQPPMVAGLFGYMGYDTVRLTENLPAQAEPTLGIAESMFVLPKMTLVFDAVDDSVLLSAPIYPFLSKDEPKKLYQQTIANIKAVGDALKQVPKEIVAEKSGKEFKVQSNISERSFKQAVLKAKQYILDGDIFQVVLSQRFNVPFDGEAFSFYRRLRAINPSPFLFFFDFDDFAVAGPSPEVMVRLRDGKTSIRPIAGTRQRGATKQQDEALAQELLADPKERAEHLMLLDLGRNDTSKVAQPGTVKVTEKMKVERYSHVMHIVSNVEGEVSPTKDAVDCLLAGFPAGTVSGAPKVRAMQIIDELEPIRRELYAGAVGYFSAFGEMDTCIALRTALIKDKTLYVQAGAGIVADSDPHKEFIETKNKAQALITAARDLFG